MSQNFYNISQNLNNFNQKIFDKWLESFFKASNCTNSVHIAITLKISQPVISIPETKKVK